MEASVLIFFLLTAQPTTFSGSGTGFYVADSGGFGRFLLHVISSYDVSHLSY